MRSKPTDARAVFPKQDGRTAKNLHQCHLSSPPVGVMLQQIPCWVASERVPNATYQILQTASDLPPAKAKGKRPAWKLQTSQMLTVDQMWTISRSFTENPCDFVINLDPHLYREGDGASCLGIGWEATLSDITGGTGGYRNDMDLGCRLLQLLGRKGDFARSNLAKGVPVSLETRGQKCPCESHIFYTVMYSIQCTNSHFTNWKNEYVRWIGNFCWVLIFCGDGQCTSLPHPGETVDSYIVHCPSSTLSPSNVAEVKSLTLP